MTDETQKNGIKIRKAVIDYIIEHYLFRDCQIVASFQARASEYVKLNGHGALSKATWEIIYFLCSGLFSKSNVSVSDIYSSIDVSKSAVIRYIHRLEDWGIVEKRNDPEDRRRWFLSFTPEFENVITEAVDYCADQYGTLLHLNDPVVRFEGDDVLRERLSRFKDFAEVAADWFWETDANHRFKWFSESHASYLQVAQGVNIGKKRWDFHRPSTVHERQQMERHKEEIDAHRSFRDFIYKVNLQNGNEAWCATNGNPIFDENGVFKGYFGSARDVTNRREILEALRRSEDRLRSVVSLASDGSWIIDREFRYTWFSNGTKPVLPWSESQALGKPFWERFGRDSYMGERGRAEIRGILELQKPFHDLLFRVGGGPDESLEWYLTSGVPVLDNKGQFDGYQGIFKNVTEKTRSDILSDTNKRVMASLIEGRPPHELVSLAISVIEKLRPGREAGVYFRSGATFHLFDEVNGKPEVEMRSEKKNVGDQISRSLSKLSDEGTKGVRKTAPVYRLTEGEAYASDSGNYWILPFHKRDGVYKAALIIWIGAAEVFGKHEREWLNEVRQMLELAIVQPNSGILHNVN